MSTDCIPMIAAALTALGNCHQTVVRNDGCTIGELRHALEQHGFSVNGDFLVGDNCEETDDMTTLISEGVIITNLEIGRVKVSIRADPTGLYISTMGSDDFHFETFCSSWRLYSLQDLVNVDEGFFSCGNNGISCGPQTTALLSDIYLSRGATYDKFNGKDPSLFLNNHHFANNIV